VVRGGIWIALAVQWIRYMTWAIHAVHPVMWEYMRIVVEREREREREREVRMYCAPTVRAVLLKYMQLVVYDEVHVVSAVVWKHLEIVVMATAIFVKHGL
jgi:hypothetical protein